MSRTRPLKLAGLAGAAILAACLAHAQLPGAGDEAKVRQIEDALRVFDITAYPGGGNGRVVPGTAAERRLNDLLNERFRIDKKPLPDDIVARIRGFCPTCSAGDPAPGPRPLGPTGTPGSPSPSPKATLSTRIE